MVFLQESFCIFFCSIRDRNTSRFVRWRTKKCLLNWSCLVIQVGVWRELLIGRKQFLKNFTAMIQSVSKFKSKNLLVTYISNVTILLRHLVLYSCRFAECFDCQTIWNKFNCYSLRSSWYTHLSSCFLYRNTFF